MSTLKLAGVALGLLMASHALAQEGPQRIYGFGETATQEELSRFFSIPPSGRGLPPGSGTGEAGEEVFINECSACHGEDLAGIPDPGIGGDRLIGGRGSLASESPVKTVESYWPYPTTLFDYVKRAMPFHAPGSLSDDDVYAVVAYILSKANIVGQKDRIDAETLPKVEMPNKDGFIEDSRPEHALYR